MSLNRKQLSFLITAFSMAILVLGLYNISLGKESGKEDEYIVEMMLAEEDIEELLKEKETLEELSNAEAIQSHLALNETAKPSFDEPEPLQTLDELRAEQALISSGDGSDALIDGAYAERVKQLEKKRVETEQKLQDKNADKKEFTNNLAAKRTSISYSLVDRNNYKLPPPIYTCIEGGKVVINIRVDATGNVTEADFNEKSSSTTNGCLVENAISYALKAQFNESRKITQKGTITYLFQQKNSL